MIAVSDSLPSKSPFPASIAPDPVHQSSSNKIEPIFQRVFVRKLDGKLIDGKPKTVSYIEDCRTRDVYLDKSLCEIRRKCIYIAFVFPVYTGMVMTGHLLYAFYRVVRLGHHAFKQLGEKWVVDRLNEGLKGFKDRLFEIKQAIEQGALDSGSALYYGIQVEGVMLYGCFWNPDEGRIWESEIEKKLWKNADYRKSFFQLRPQAGKSLLTNLCENILKAEACYLAHCFQPRGKITDTSRFEYISCERR
jgi:hypothetical protein